VGKASRRRVACDEINQGKTKGNIMNQGYQGKTKRNNHQDKRHTGPYISVIWLTGLTTAGPKVHSKIIPKQQNKTMNQVIDFILGWTQPIRRSNSQTGRRNSTDDEGLFE
jgi:hypothetical protein